MFHASFEVFTLAIFLKLDSSTIWYTIYKASLSFLCDYYNVVI